MRSPLIVCSLLVMSLELLGGALGCEGTSDQKSGSSRQFPTPSVAEIDRDAITLREARVYFNHQSVGANLLEGIERVAPNLPISHFDDKAPEDLTHKGILESTLGRNTDPSSKFRGFAEGLARMPQPPDIALMKLCYVDFTDSTDVGALFAEYEKTLTALEAKYPKTRFLHVTVPLVSKSGTWKARIKEWLGRSAANTNERREAFSDLLRQRYGDERVFDLAKLESTAEDGAIASLSKAGRTIRVLVPAYTSDGGHLNDKGKDLLARQFIAKLARAYRGQ